MKWQKILADIYDDKFDDICPVCKNKTLRYEKHLLDKSQNAGYVDIYCLNCDAREQVDFRHWNKN